MLDFFLILTAGGLGLFEWTFPGSPSAAARAAVVNALISEAILAGHGSGGASATGRRVQVAGGAGPASAAAVAAAAAFTYHSTVANYLYNSQRGLLLIAAHPKVIDAVYAPRLLERMERVFLHQLEDRLPSDTKAAPSTNAKGKNSKRPVNPLKGLSAEDRAWLGRAFLEVLNEVEDDVDLGSPAAGPPVSRGKGLDADANQDEHSLDDAAPLASRSGKRGGRQQRFRKSSGNDGAPRSGKAARKWGDSSLTPEEIDALDYSASAAQDAVDVDRFVDQGSLGKTQRDGSYIPQELGIEFSDKEGADASSSAPAFLKSVVNMFSTSRALTESDLAPVLAKMESHLVNKNIAMEVVRDLLDSVQSSLIGKRIGWTTVHKHIRQALEERLERVLLPSASTDLLRDIFQAQALGRPYKLVFCGVNGVGKSTNLAKITFWLLRNNLSVLIAACDTFRSGAVEQLRTHVRNLRALAQQLGHDDVRLDLFERGYGKDAAGIAREAIAHAQETGFQVVLVDTAGRMQDNEPLMRSLAKLTAVNQPDKIVFVGEALVGNESIDQLVKFNTALRDFSSQAHPRDIDALLLTKFDVIADKVGAAVSMTYITRRPILFVGTGQTYTDLKRINVAAIVAALLG